jgi:hypothetical protein
MAARQIDEVKDGHSQLMVVTQLYLQ